MSSQNDILLHLLYWAMTPFSLIIYLFCCLWEKSVCIFEFHFPLWLLVLCKATGTFSVRQPWSKTLNPDRESFSSLPIASPQIKPSIFSSLRAPPPFPFRLYEAIHWYLWRHLAPPLNHFLRVLAAVRQSGRFMSGKTSVPNLNTHTPESMEIISNWTRDDYTHVWNSFKLILKPTVMSLSDCTHARYKPAG